MTDSQEQADVWQLIEGQVAWLDRSNGTGRQETALRLMKIAEEAGEAVAAYAGMLGQNPRKGITHTDADVADELCDVVITAMVALYRFTPDPQAHFADRLRRVAARSAGTRTGP
ncbi:hypothetical protein BX265_8100 [Streptomyces sp. TLI_235]|nr:hypothetical protein [Streptomyces sp. TLI_235]PBC67493.1 hypothetical protein BX265_8100 [Streptomyces sp. TLI_235]